jgi:hypothetical protein
MRGAHPNHSWALKGSCHSSRTRGDSSLSRCPSGSLGKPTDRPRKLTLMWSSPRNAALKKLGF